PGYRSIRTPTASTSTAEASRSTSGERCWSTAKTTWATTRFFARRSGAPRSRTCGGSGSGTHKGADSMTVTPTSVTLPVAMGSPEFAADPPAHYAWLREHAPVGKVRLDFGSFAYEVWALSRYADCKSLLTDPRLRRSPSTQDHTGDEVAEHIRLVTS